MITVRPSRSRGGFDHGWLDTHHTFSFGAYRDPAHMGFRSLRVINEDRVAPGAGFDEHGHSDMEILTWVLSGRLRHADSTGGGEVIVPGMIQRMTAGAGIRHSEFNDSSTEPVHLLQSWIRPDRAGHEPGYESRSFTGAELRNRLRTLTSPDGRDDSVKIHQDAVVLGAQLDAGASVRHPIGVGRGVWLQVARGAVRVNGVRLAQGDGAAAEDESGIDIEAEESAEVLIFDLG